MNTSNARLYNISYQTLIKGIQIDLNKQQQKRKQNT